MDELAKRWARRSEGHLYAAEHARVLLGDGARELEADPRDLGELLVRGDKRDMLHHTVPRDTPCCINVCNSFTNSLCRALVDRPRASTSEDKQWIPDLGQDFVQKWCIPIVAEILQ